jgi:DNA-binding transcriptional ArsR family regulator
VNDPVTPACRALAHPVRRMVLRAVLRSECDVGQLEQCCGVDQPTVSKHLAVLRRAGLVRVRIEGRRRCYVPAQEDILRPLLDLLDRLPERMPEPPEREPPSMM